MDEKHPEQTRWNQKYIDRDLSASMLHPSPFLKKQEARLLDLRADSSSQLGALDIACGDGRNSFYLDSLGFAVDAVDISDVVIRWVETQAELRGSLINPLQLDLTTTPFPQQHYAVIICFRYLQRDLFPSMIESLLPGGLLIFETMHRDYADKLGHHMNPQFLLGDNELLRVFSDLRVLHYEEGGEAGVASLVATKSAY